MLNSASAILASWAYTVLVSELVWVREHFLPVDDFHIRDGATLAKENGTGSTLSTALPRRARWTGCAAQHAGAKCQLPTGITVVPTRQPLKKSLLC